MKKAIAFSCLLLWMVVPGAFAEDEKPNIVLEPGPTFRLEKFDC